MRGRTLNNSFVVIDEAQNCTYGQIKMLLTRLGWHSHMVITGDPDQTDLLPGMSGLMDIAKQLESLSDTEIVRLGPQDVVRHPLVAKDNIHCYGINSCKGSADCKTTAHECKGMNACKGHGFKAMKAGECIKAGGTIGDIG